MTKPWWEDPSFADYPAGDIAAFRKWHEANPQVYVEFASLARQMRNTGRTRYSAYSIVEVLRWHRNLKTQGDVFEINNDWRPFYARLLMFYQPEFIGFFELRKIRSQGIKSDEQNKRELNEEMGLGL